MLRYMELFIWVDQSRANTDMARKCSNSAKRAPCVWLSGLSIRKRVATTAGIRMTYRLGMSTRPYRFRVAIDSNHNPRKRYRHPFFKPHRYFQTQAQARDVREIPTPILREKKRPPWKAGLNILSVGSICWLGTVR